MTPPQNIHRIRVRVSEMKVAKGDAVLVSIGLGSCVGVAVYDTEQEVGGMAHVLLPGDPKPGDNPLKYSDSAVEKLVEEICSMGGSKDSMRAKVFGGSNMFPGLASDRKKSIGERNVEAVLKKLEQMGIEVVAKDIGGDKGRTVEFLAGKGNVTVRNASGQESSF